MQTCEHVFAYCTYTICVLRMTCMHAQTHNAGIPLFVHAHDCMVHLSGMPDIRPLACMYSTCVLHIFLCVLTAVLVAALCMRASDCTYISDLVSAPGCSHLLETVIERNYVFLAAQSRCKARGSKIAKPLHQLSPEMAKPRSWKVQEHRLVRQPEEECLEGCPEKLLQHGRG